MQHRKLNFFTKVMEFVWQRKQHNVPLLLQAVLALLLMILQHQSITATDTQFSIGSWQLLNQNAGIASMHTIVTRFGTVILLDRTNIGATRINLPNGRCRDNPQERRLKHDCYAHSVEFNTFDNTVRPLFIFTDTWCSSGQYLANGTILQTGGDFEGLKKIRSFTPCAPGGTCDWVEQSVGLSEGRWYASNQLLPDGRHIVVGGRGSKTYEFVPKGSDADGVFELQFLIDTPDFNLYPYVHLLPDGNLFIFANTNSVLFDYKTNTVLRTYPSIPGDPRNYPAAGSSVMLAVGGSFTDAEVMVCGGADRNAFSSQGIKYFAEKSCGRMMVTSPDPQWEMQDMPLNRTMGDMILLPTSQILIINGAQMGGQGWGFAANATLNPVLYDPDSKLFYVLPPTSVPRVYHSTANLLSDGRILLAGSNTHELYSYPPAYNGEFPTEFRVEAFYPWYSGAYYDTQRPQIIQQQVVLSYGTQFSLQVSLAGLVTGSIELTLTSAPFVTHSYAMGQRQVKLSTQPPVAVGPNLYNVTATAPLNAILAPPSWYMLFPLYNMVPGSALWVQVANP